MTGAGQQKAKELDEIREAARLLHESSARVRDKGRPPTSEERIIAAWANLAIEEPDVTIEDVRRALTTKD